MYSYDTCGLDNVYLLNGYEETETSEGKATSIHDLDGLHQAMAESIVELGRPLEGPEFKFLRVEMDLSQKSVGRIFDKTDQAVAKWEKGTTGIPLMADASMRQIYMESLGKDSKLRELLSALNELDRSQQQHEMRFEDTDEGWKSAS